MSASVAILRHLRRQLGTSAPDADLLRAYAERRDEDAFRALVERHGPMILGVCRRRLGDIHAADDAFQATFLALARNVRSVRRPEALDTWLYKVALRVCGRARAAAVRRREVERQSVARPSADVSAELTARELLNVLDEELIRLPERYLRAIWLVYWQGLPHAEAAAQLNLSPAALHGRLDRGRKRLADRLRRRGFEPDAAARALLVAGAGAMAVPGDLTARTVVLGVAPWSTALPTAVVVLAASAVPSKLLPTTALVLLVLGAGTIGLIGSPERERPEDPPPVAHAPGPPEQPPAAPRVDRYGDPLPAGALLRLGTTRYRSYDTITHLSVRLGGRHVAFCNRDAVVFMDVRTGLTLHRYPGGSRTVNGRERGTVCLNALAFAPDGRTFATGGHDDGPEPPSPLPFWLYDAATGQRLREFAGHDQRVTALAFVADGRQITSLGGDGLVRIWDAATGGRLRELSRPDGKLVSLVASPDGRMLATGADARDGKAAVHLWDAASGRLLHTLVGHTAAVQALAFAPDGRTLGSGGKATIRLWDVTTGRELRQFAAPAGEIRTSKPLIHSIAFSPDGRLIAAARTDSGIRVWSLADGQLLDQTERYSSFPVGLAFLDARTLLIGGGRTLLLRDVVTRSFKDRADGSEYGIGRVGISADGRTVATADPDSNVHTWDARDGRHLSVKEWSPSTVVTLVSPDGRVAAFTAGEGAETVTCLGDVATGRVVRRLVEKEHHPAAFSADSRTLVTLLVREPKTPDEPTLRVWDIASGEQLGRIKVGHVGFAIAVAPDRRSLFMSENDQPIKQWDIAAGRPTRELRLGPNPRVIRGSALAASPGGRRLAIAGDDSTVRMWDVVCGKECWAGEAAAVGVEAVAFSPDGTLVAVGHSESDGQIDLWDARTGRRLARVAGHQPRHGVTGLAFSRDGRRLVSGSFDCTALVWDVEAVIGRPLRPLDDGRQIQLWDDLGGDPSAVAHAIDCWQAAPNMAVSFLRRRLNPIAAVPSDRVATLLTDLDSASFTTREAASKSLEQLGPGATGPVRAAIAKTTSAEVRRRAQVALEAWERQARRDAHAVEILETVVAPDARRLLADLAAGAPDARLTREAKASLDRMRAPRGKMPAWPPISPPRSPRLRLRDPDRGRRNLAALANDLGPDDLGTLFAALGRALPRNPEPDHACARTIAMATCAKSNFRSSDAFSFGLRRTRHYSHR